MTDLGMRDGRTDRWLVATPYGAGRKWEPGGTDHGEL